MKHIVLCCAAGMSTSMLVTRMQAEAAKRNLEISIKAVPTAEFELEIEFADVVLLGPQVRYELERFSKIAKPLGKPVALINMMDYGTMRGDKVLDTALSMMA
jgi:PTS system cellobiose-specific IIB component